MAWGNWSKAERCTSGMLLQSWKKGQNHCLCNWLSGWWQKRQSVLWSCLWCLRRSAVKKVPLRQVRRRAWSSSGHWCRASVVRAGLINCRAPMVLREADSAKALACHARHRRSLSSCAEQCMTSQGMPWWSKNTVVVTHCQATCWRRLSRTLKGPGRGATASLTVWWTCIAKTKSSREGLISRIISAVCTRAKHWGSCMGCSTAARCKVGEVPGLCSPMLHCSRSQVLKVQVGKVHGLASMEAIRPSFDPEGSQLLLVWRYGSSYSIPQRLYSLASPGDGGISNLLGVLDMSPQVTSPVSGEPRLLTKFSAMQWGDGQTVGLIGVNLDFQQAPKSTKTRHSFNHCIGWISGQFNVINIGPQSAGRNGLLAECMA